MQIPNYYFDANFYITDNKSEYEKYSMIIEGKQMISYIVAMDNSYALMSNFIGFLTPILTIDDEVIIVSDGCNNYSTLEYIKHLVKSDFRFQLIELKEKCGFSKANNIGVNASKYENLIFINTDIFPTYDCIPNMINMLNQSENIAAVQPLLLYPQNGLVQSTGHVFSKVKSGQLFAMRNCNDPLIHISAPRQALTMALCAVKKSIFYKMNGFNEEYYNSHEGMELTLKMTIFGYTCMYCADAIAYHCSGLVRTKVPFDISRQRAYFYQQWTNYISNDLEIYLSQQINSDMASERYIVYNISSSTDWKRILETLKLNYTEEILLQERFAPSINLYDCISFTSLYYPVPYLFLCNSFTQISSNYNWIKNRNNPKDIIMDLNGNVLRLISLIGE